MRNHRSLFCYTRRHTLYPLKLDKLAALKLKWGVSMAAILMHADRMGCITERYCRYLYMQMSKMGYRTLEPHSDKIKLERASKIANMLEHIKSQCDLTDEKLAEILGVFPEELATYSKRDEGHRFTVI